MKRQEANDFRLRSFGHAEYIAFVCECANEDCKRTVLLTPGAFKTRRERGELVLFAGHAALADAPLAVEREALDSTAQTPDLAAENPVA